MKKLGTRGGYSPARGLQNTNPQIVVAPVEKNLLVPCGHLWVKLWRFGVQEVHYCKVRMADV